MTPVPAEPLRARTVQIVPVVFSLTCRLPLAPGDLRRGVRRGPGEQVVVRDDVIRAVVGVRRCPRRKRPSAYHSLEGVRPRPRPTTTDRH